MILALILIGSYLRKLHGLELGDCTDHYGIPEGLATRSGNGCLAGYIVKHRYFRKDPIDLRVEQDYEIGRPSLLRLKAESVDGKIELYVCGKFVIVAQGVFV